MTTCMHFMQPPKIVQIWWRHHDHFCVRKKSAITFGEGCTSFHLPGVMPYDIISSFVYFEFSNDLLLDLQ